MFEEEKNAIELDKILRSLLKKNNIAAEHTLTRLGVNSSCDVTTPSRKYHISCFGDNEYYLELIEKGSTIATGRTYIVDEVHSIALIWLKDGSLDSLYQKYSFIDKALRKFDEIINIIKNAQNIVNSQIEIEIKHKGCDIYELVFEGKNRHCKLYFYGKEEVPRIEFYWSGTYLFRLNIDNYELLALIFVRWLVDEISPSELEKQFTWTSTGELAKYYEQGRGIEGEFILSWITTVPLTFKTILPADDLYRERLVDYH